MTRSACLFSLLCLAAILLGGCATAPTAGEDTGYFLSMKQKGQLIGTGRIQDTAGLWYDVWIVPGYVQPARRTMRYLDRTGQDFAEYGSTAKYKQLGENSGDAFEWAFEDCLVDFTIKGVPRAWDDYWSTASQRTRQRVFGWWFAYPWAMLEITADTVVRIPAGLTGMVLGSAWGLAVVPTYYMVNSAGKGLWHFGIDAFLFPTLAVTWNTVIAPPLALAGQKPSPARADGFWLQELGSDLTRADADPDAPLPEEDVRALADWADQLLTAGQPYMERRTALDQQSQAEREALNQKIREAEAALQVEEQAAMEALIAAPAGQAALIDLQNRGLGSGLTWQAKRDLRNHLASNKNLSKEDVDRALRLLTSYPPATFARPAPRRTKTDPVERSLEVIREME